MSDRKACSVAFSSALPLDKESWVRKTAVVCCIVRCMESRKVEVGVLPEELRKVLISVMEGRPMFEGVWWCAAEGA
jgi:hypothetical protein